MSQKCHKQKIQYLQGLQVKCHMSQKFLGVILALGTSGGLAIMHRMPMRRAARAVAIATRPCAG